MGKDDSLIYRPQHMGFPVKFRQPHKGSPGLRILGRTIEEGQKDHFQFFRRNPLHPPVGQVINALSPFFASSCSAASRFRMNHSIFPAEVGLLSSIRKYPGIQYMELSATVPFVTGFFVIYSLMLQVPASYRGPPPGQVPLPAHRHPLKHTCRSGRSPLPSPVSRAPPGSHRR